MFTCVVEWWWRNLNGKAMSTVSYTGRQQITTFQVRWSYSSWCIIDKQRDPDPLRRRLGRPRPAKHMTIHQALHSTLHHWV